MNDQKRATPHLGTNAVKPRGPKSAVSKSAPRRHARSRIEMAKRLAEEWRVTAINTDLKMSVDDVALALQILNEEAQFLFDSGLLGVVERQKYGSDLVAFDELVWLMEKTGWLKIRTQKSMEYMRSEAERLPRRAAIVRAEAKAREDAESPTVVALAS